MNQVLLMKQCLLEKIPLLRQSLGLASSVDEISKISEGIISLLKAIKIIKEIENM